MIPTVDPKLVLWRTVAGPPEYHSAIMLVAAPHGALLGDAMLLGQDPTGRLTCRVSS